MAITLATEDRPARVTKMGSETFTAVAGKTVKIETSPQGVEILNATVPAGKTWTVTVHVYIMET